MPLYSALPHADGGSSRAPDAVAGAANSVSFRMDRQSGNFELNYTTISGVENSTNCDHNMSDFALKNSCLNSTSTEIFLNEKMWYPQGFRVLLQMSQEILSEGEEEWVDAEKANVLSWYMRRRNYLVVQHEKGTIKRVRVIISRV